VAVTLYSSNFQRIVMTSTGFSSSTCTYTDPQNCFNAGNPGTFLFYMASTVGTTLITQAYNASPVYAPYFTGSCTYGNVTGQAQFYSYPTTTTPAGGDVMNPTDIVNWYGGVVGYIPLDGYNPASGTTLTINGNYNTGASGLPSTSSANYGIAVITGYNGGLAANPNFLSTYNYNASAVSDPARANPNPFSLSGNPGDIFFCTCAQDQSGGCIIPDSSDITGAAQFIYPYDGPWIPQPPPFYPTINYISGNQSPTYSAPGGYADSVGSAFGNSAFGGHPGGMAPYNWGFFTGTTVNVGYIWNDAANPFGYNTYSYSRMSKGGWVIHAGASATRRRWFWVME